MKEQSHFDLERALAGVAGHPHMLTDLVKLFLNEYPEQLEKIQAAIRNRDIAQLKLVSSALKGSLSILRATHAYDAICVVERLAELDRLDEAPAAGEKLAESLELLRDQLIKLV